MKLIITFFVVLTSLSVWAGPKVAIVEVIRGEVDSVTLGKTTRLKLKDWVENGSVVKTAEKSFVKLKFIDESSMNIGPKSEMKVESFTGKDSTIIDLVKGKVRSEVSKNTMQMGKDKSKLFIKTQNAVMGVRGTDFIISTNGTTTSTVLFHGEIVFNKLEERGELSSDKLEEIVDRGVRMHPGEFSVMEMNRIEPTVPALLNIQQINNLERNKEFDTNRNPSNAANEPAKSIVPAGLSGQQVSNTSGTLQNQVSQVAPNTAPQTQTPASSDPNGYVKENHIKPANGSFVHIDSGTIIPPSPGSVLDTNTNTYIPGKDSGKVAADGSYIPPKNVEITDDGKVLVSQTDAKGSTYVKEIPKPIPVISPGVNGSAFGPDTIATASGEIVAGHSKNRDVSLPGEVSTDSRYIPNANGGLQGVNDPTRILGLPDTAEATIRVNKPGTINP